MVKSCTWNEEAGKWHVQVQDLKSGAVTEDICDVVINGNGVLNVPKFSYVKDVDKFQGKVMHTARFDTSYDFKGKKVAIIGTGATYPSSVGEVGSGKRNIP